MSTMTVSARTQEYLRYAPYQPRNRSPSSSSSSSSPTPRESYLPYSTQFQQISSIPSEKLPMDDCDYTSFLPLWAELALSEKESSYIPAITTSTEYKNAAYLPRFQPVPQPQSSPKASEYSNFFCRQCGCPLADRYGLHDLDDDDDWKEEYEACPLNVQTKEWARSLEMLRVAEREAKAFMGQERRRPRHLPKIDTEVSDRYRTGLQRK